MEGVSLLVVLKCLGFITAILTVRSLFLFFLNVVFFPPQSYTYLQKIEKFFDLFVDLTFPGYTKFYFM